jgi:hypothetical protein
MQDVLHNIKELGFPCTLQRVRERCVMANGEPCVIAEIAVLSIKIGSFSWKWRFSILRDSPIPCILGVDYMSNAKVQLDFAARKYSFLFCPERNFDFESFELRQGMSLKFPSPIKLVAGLLYEPSVANSEEPADTVELLQCFPGLFSDC